MAYPPLASPMEWYTINDGLVGYEADQASRYRTPLTEKVLTPTAAYLERTIELLNRYCGRRLPPETWTRERDDFLQTAVSCHNYIEQSIVAQFPVMAAEVERMTPDPSAHAEIETLRQLKHVMEEMRTTAMARTRHIQANLGSFGVYPPPNQSNKMIFTTVSTNGSSHQDHPRAPTRKSTHPPAVTVTAGSMRTNSPRALSSPIFTRSSRMSAAIPSKSAISPISPAGNARPSFSMSPPTPQTPSSRGFWDPIRGDDDDVMVLD